MSCELAGNATSSEYILAESGTCYLSHETHANAVSVLLPASTTTAHIFHTQTSNHGIAKGSIIRPRPPPGRKRKSLEQERSPACQAFVAVIPPVKESFMKLPIALEGCRNSFDENVPSIWTCTPQSVHLASHCLVRLFLELGHTKKVAICSLLDT